LLPGTHCPSRPYAADNAPVAVDKLQLAITTLQTVLAVDLKPEDVEVGVVTAAHPRFRVLGRDDIEGYLTRIAEKD
jgi:20S proteasome subunit alpha 1